MGGPLKMDTRRRTPNMETCNGNISGKASLHLETHCFVLNNRHKEKQQIPSGWRRSPTNTHKSLSLLKLMFFFKKYTRRSNKSLAGGEHIQQIRGTHVLLYLSKENHESERIFSAAGASFQKDIKKS